MKCRWDYLTGIFRIPILLFLFLLGSGHAFAQADISLQVTNNITEACANTVYTFDIAISNAGPDTAKGVNLAMKVDGADVPGSPVGIGNIVPGAAAQVFLPFNFPNPGIHSIQFSVTAVTSDPFISNNTISSAVTVHFNGTLRIGATEYLKTFRSAIDTINVYGLCGPTVIDAVSGHTETSSNMVLSTQTTGPVNTLAFRGHPATVNALAGNSTTQDGVFKITGTDYVSFDSINLVDANTTVTAQMEWGFALLKKDNADGTQHVSVTNCTITLKRTNPASTGIYSANHTPSSTAELTGISLFSGTNSYNSFDGNVISSVNNGIVIKGADCAAPYLFYDHGNTVGGMKGNTIRNYGANTVNCYGVYTMRQDSLLCRMNRINNRQGGITAASPLYGIYVGTSKEADVLLELNSVSLGQRNNSYPVYGIFANVSGKGSRVRFIGDTVSGCSFNSGASGYFYGIGMENAADTCRLNNCFIINNSNLYTIGNVYFFFNETPCFSIKVEGLEISGNRKLSSAGTVYCYYNTGAPVGGEEIIDNVTLKDLRTVNSTIFYGFYSNTTWLQKKIFSYDTVTRITTGTGIFYGFYVHAGSQTRIEHCEVSEVSGANIQRGYWLDGSFCEVYENSVHGLHTSGITHSLVGVYICGGNPIRFSRNIIYDLIATGTENNIIGLSITSGVVVSIENNLITSLYAPYSPNLAIQGISVGGGTDVYLTSNTIVIDGTSTGLDFGTDCINTNAFSKLTLRNNIAVNLSVPTGLGAAVVLRRFTDDLQNYSAESNANCFYAGTPDSAHLIYAGFSDKDSTITQFKNRVTPRDALSFSENVQFQNILVQPYDLHVQPALSTQCESGGISIVLPFPLSDDMDGDTRNQNFPDVGADEFTGISYDQAPPFIQYGLLPDSYAGQTVLLNQVIISDPSGVNMNSGNKPRLYFKKSSDPNDFLGNQASFPGWKFTETGSLQSPFSFTFDFSLLAGGTVSAGDTIQYFVVAEDLSSVAHVGINAGNPSNPLTSVNLLNTQFPVTGAVNRFVIRDTLCGSFTVGSGGDYLTLTDAVKDYNQKIITCPVQFILTDNFYTTETYPITIHANAGSSSLNTLRIFPATVKAPLFQGNATSLITLNGADNVIIDGLSAGTGTQQITFENFNTSSGSCAVLVTETPQYDPACNNTIAGCILKSGYHITSNTSGVLVRANGKVNKQNNIGNNRIYSTRTGIQMISSGAGFHQGDSIFLNTIGSDLESESISFRGISVQFADSIFIDGNMISGDTNGNSNYYQAGIYLNNSSKVRISRNRIRDFSYTGTSGYSCWGIHLDQNASETDITGNTICRIRSDADQMTANPLLVNSGIFINNAGNTRIGGNSIYLSGSVMGGSGSTYQGTSSCITVNSLTTDLSILNNILVNDMTALLPDPSNRTWAIASAAPAQVFTAMDYNSYSGTGTNFHTGILDSVSYLQLMDWKQAAGKDSGSIAQYPLFISPTDLHLQTTGNCAFDGKAIPLPYAMRDIDNELRDPLKPDMGADEFSAPIHLITADSGVCAGNPFTVIATGGTWYEFFVNGASQGAPSTDSVFTLNNPMQGDTISVTGSGNNCVPVQSSLIIQLEPKPLPGSVFPSDSAVCEGASYQVVLSGSTGFIQWQQSYDNLIFSDIPFANDSLLSVPSALLPVYYRAIVSGHYCGDTVGNTTFVNVYLNPVPNLGPDTTICEHMSVQLNAGPPGYAYLWSDGSTSNTFLADTSVLGTGSVIVVVTVTNVICSAADSVEITFTPCTGYSEVEDFFVCYPNPANENVVINFSRVISGTVRLFSMDGLCVFAKQIAGSFEIIDVSGFSSGPYQMTIEQGGSIKRLQIMVTH